MPPVLERRYYDYAPPASAGESQSSNPNEGRIKNLINRVTITYETGPKA
ncbi:hypothetical protein [Candidatus Nitrosocosmicus oleophilus]|nr:hypothetical protein [Candidatus Nitrosocosmicus oleophilus]